MRQKAVAGVVVVALDSDSLVDHLEHTVSVAVVLSVPGQTAQTRLVRLNRPAAKSTNRETVDQGTLTRRHPRKVPGHFAGVGERDSLDAGADPDSVAGEAPVHLHTALDSAVDRQKQTLLNAKVSKQYHFR